MKVLDKEDSGAMNKVQKNFLYNVLYQILLIILPLITAPYVSRILGPTALGEYAYTYSVAYYFLLIAMLGISNQGNRSIAAVQDQPQEVSKVFWSLYKIQAITFAIALILYVGYLMMFVKNNIIIATIQLIYIVSGLFDISWLYFGLEKFKVTVVRNCVIKLITVAAIFIFVKSPDDLWVYAVIMSTGMLLSQLYLWLQIKQYVVFKRTNIRECIRHIRPILILFIPVIAYSIYKVMDKIMLGAMTNYEQVGLFESAEKIINIPMGIITALGTVMLPRMSNIIAKGDTHKTNEYIRISFKVITIIASAIAFGLMGVSNVLAPVFFGEGFEGCSSIISLLSYTVVFIAWANIIRTQYLIPMHRDSVYLFSTIFGAVINLLINIVLIPKYHANGAAIGTIAAEFTVMIVQMIAVAKILPVYKYVLSYVPIIVIGFIMNVIVSYLGMIMDTSVVTLLVQVSVGGLFFILAVLCFLKITKDELWDSFIAVIHSITFRIKNKKGAECLFENKVK